jgi:DNA-binding winged helix-turn-helix (wHTH) protein
MHAGQLVTKEALLDAIWPETAVGEGVLKTSMNELRKTLGETAKAPQWIATVHRRGYRFVAPVTLGESATHLRVLNASAPMQPHVPSCYLTLPVGVCTGSLCQPGARGGFLMHPAPWTATEKAA